MSYFYYLLANSERDMDYLVNNNIKFIKNVSNAIAEECNFKKTIKQNNKWIKYFKDFKEYFKLQSNFNCTRFIIILALVYKLYTDFT